VRQVIVETSRVKSLLLQVNGWQGHLPGQHVDIRLTAEDGYQAQRSYSIASPPEDEFVTLTVERVENGEVSPYLVEQLRSGDQFELRGPIGGYCAWTIAIGGPLCLISAGNCALYGDAPSPRQSETVASPRCCCVHRDAWRT
jgi:ferredoxin-NADP reductase